MSHLRVVRKHGEQGKQTPETCVPCVKESCGTQCPDIQQGPDAFDQIMNTDDERCIDCAFEHCDEQCTEPFPEDGGKPYDGEDVSFDDDDIADYTDEDFPDEDFPEGGKPYDGEDVSFDDDDYSLAQKGRSLLSEHVKVGAPTGSMFEVTDCSEGDEVTAIFCRSEDKLDVSKTAKGYGAKKAKIVRIFDEEYKLDAVSGGDGTVTKAQTLKLPKVEVKWDDGSSECTVVPRHQVFKDGTTKACRQAPGYCHSGKGTVGSPCLHNSQCGPDTSDPGYNLSCCPYLKQCLSQTAASADQLTPEQKAMQWGGWKKSSSGRVCEPEQNALAGYNLLGLCQPSADPTDGGYYNEVVLAHGFAVGGGSARFVPFDPSNPMCNCNEKFSKMWEAGVWDGCDLGYASGKQIGGKGSSASAGKESSAGGEAAATPPPAAPASSGGSKELVSAGLTYVDVTAKYAAFGYSCVVTRKGGLSQSEKAKKLVCDGQAVHIRGGLAALPDRFCKCPVALQEK